MLGNTPDTRAWPQCACVHVLHASRGHVYMYQLLSVFMAPRLQGSVMTSFAFGLAENVAQSFDSGSSGVKSLNAVLLLPGGTNLFYCSPACRGPSCFQNASSGMGTPKQLIATGSWRHSAPVLQVGGSTFRRVVWGRGVAGGGAPCPSAPVSTCLCGCGWRYLVGS